jgi:hypothetical protein
MPSQTVTFEGTFRPEQEKNYAYVPFEMPGHATRLEVRLDYSHRIGSDPLLTGGNTVDLGVFDARGIGYLTAGFRGWSGSERSSFFIGETEATPGYLAGPLVPGTWNILLGLYKIAPEGCTYRVTVTIAVEPGGSNTATLPAPVGSLPVSVPRGPSVPWLRGELHCHTWHSDGDTSPADLVRLARERGLDLLAITDHNTTSSQRELARLGDPGLVLIRGMEVTTFKGHFNVWGISDWVDFRVTRPEEMAAALRFASERGALTCCNHPKPSGPPWDYRSVTNYDCIEVWNGPWTPLNQVALDFWASQLAAGRRIPATGGSDWHRRRELEQASPRAPGIPTVWVHVPGAATEATVLEAIRQGHVSLSDRPDGPFVELRAGTDFSALCGDVVPRPDDNRLRVRVHCRWAQGLELRILDQRGILHQQLLSEPEETEILDLAIADSLFVRAELRAPNQDLRGLTNPIYLSPAVD